MQIVLYSPTAAALSLCSSASCGWHWDKDGTESYEQSWKKRKDWPQYKYFAIPVYKFTASKTNSVVGAAVSFFATDFLFHQVLPQAGILLLNKVSPVSIPGCSTVRSICWYPLISLGWLSVGAPVIYAKYLKNRNMC